MVGAILAGGQSRRFGSNKAFALFQGERLIDRQVRLLVSIFEQVMVVTDFPDRFLHLDVTLVQDIIPGQGPLGGIYTALVFAQGQSVFITACDMPFLQAPVIKHMLEFCAGYDVVIPEKQDFLEPLHAVYSSRCLPHIKRALDRNEYQVITFFKAVKVKRIGEDKLRQLDPLGLSFFNVNRPEDMARARELLAGRETETQ